ncbi:MAG: FAD-dependent oxidoreductase [Nitrospiraceae bacterium]|jgi:hypothetical protein
MWGGRVRTDRVEGFQLDRGFQVFLTGYPEARQTLDYPSLDLRLFHTGAVIRYAGRFHRLSDPLRRPPGSLNSSGLPSPAGQWRFHETGWGPLLINLPKPCLQG